MAQCAGHHVLRDAYDAGKHSWACQQTIPISSLLFCTHSLEAPQTRMRVHFVTVSPHPVSTAPILEVCIRSKSVFRGGSHLSAAPELSGPSSSTHAGHCTTPGRFSCLQGPYPGP